MLNRNKSLEKILLQHNYLGGVGIQSLVDAIKTHPKIKYLDISANEIGSNGLMAFWDLLNNNHQL